MHERLLSPTNLDAPGLERLARRLALLSDEDAAQDTLVTALRAGEPRGAGWFATVAQNLARRRRRDAAARHWRESVAARPEADAAASAALERAEVAQRLLSAVLALAEPYRGVTLLRYFDDLTPAAIARRTARTPEAVRKQLERAHALLRARLAPATDDGRDWLTALAPLCARVPGRESTAALGAAPLVTAAAAIALLAGVAWLRPWSARVRSEAAVSRSRVEAPVEVNAEVTAATPREAALGEEATARSAARAALGAAEESPEASAAEVTNAAHHGAGAGAAASEAGAVIEGRVVRADGAPVEGAEVDFGYSTARSDAAGRFRLRVPLRELDDDPPLTAWRRGLGPAAVAGLSAALRGTGRLDDVVLRLLDEAHVARGRVVDDHGDGLAGWWVTLADGTRHGSYGTPLEYAAAGIAGLGVTTDAAGEFRVGGLLPREYTLRAIDLGTGVVLERQVGPGGWDVLFTLGPDALRARVVGRVVDPTGAPIVGAEVQLERTVVDVGFSAVLEATHTTRTDRDGGFVLERVPCRNVALVVGGDEALRTTRPIEEHLAAEDVALVATRRFRFLVALRPGERATHARVLDGSGAELVLDFDLPDLQAHRPLLPLSGPGTPAVARVSAAATTLVLEREGRELRRVPLTLAPGMVTRIEP